MAEAPGTNMAMSVHLTFRNRFQLCDGKILLGTDVEILRLQIHLPYCKSVPAAGFYRPPGANVVYLDRKCENLDIVTDKSKDIFLLCDLNINWFSKNCPSHKKLISLADACDIRISATTGGVNDSTSTDHIFTDVNGLCNSGCGMQ